MAKVIPAIQRQDRLDHGVKRFGELTEIAAQLTSEERDILRAALEAYETTARQLMRPDDMLKMSRFIAHHVLIAGRLRATLGA